MKKTAIIILTIFLLSMTSGCIETGQGMSKDVVFGIEKQGLVWKTWSVWLLSDHPAGNQGKEGFYSAIYSVPLDNPALVTQIQQAALTNKTMVIEYKNYWFVFPWDYSSTTVITGISEIKK